MKFFAEISLSEQTEIQAILSNYMLNEGDSAADFAAKNQNGEIVKSADWRGKRVILYFYPKDDTPGCTKQACSLRDSFDAFERKNIKVFGVSIDDEKSHRKFIEKYALPFDLLADSDKEIVNLFGVYGEKTNYGKKYMGVNRTTFLIDETGKIVKIFKKVKVEQHADEVLEVFEKAKK